MVVVMGSAHINDIGPAYIFQYHFITVSDHLEIKTNYHICIGQNL